jgi:hypothetical protein
LRSALPPPARASAGFPNKARGDTIHLKNIGLKGGLEAAMAAVREKNLELGEAYAEMTRTMLQ